MLFPPGAAGALFQKAEVQLSAVLGGPGGNRNYTQACKRGRLRLVCLVASEQSQLHIVKPVKKRLFTLTVNQRSGKTGSERSAKCRLFYCLMTVYMQQSEPEHHNLV